MNSSTSMGDFRPSIKGSRSRTFRSLPIFLAIGVGIVGISHDVCGQAPAFAWVRQGGGVSTGATGASISIAADNSGNCYLAGGHSASATFGERTLTKAGAFVASYDDTGKLLWIRSPGIGGFYDIAFDKLGNYIAAGNFSDSASGSTNGFIAKYDASGLLLWVKDTDGNRSFVHPFGVVIDTGGNAYLTGEFQGTNDFGQVPFDPVTRGERAPFIAKYNDKGVLQWGKRVGGRANGEGHAIGVDRDGNTYVTGYFRGIFDCGSSAITNRQDNGMFVAKYDAEGRLKWARGEAPLGNHGVKELLWTRRAILTSLVFSDLLHYRTLEAALNKEASSADDSMTKVTCFGPKALNRKRQ